MRKAGTARVLLRWLLLLGVVVDGRTRRTLERTRVVLYQGAQAALLLPVPSILCTLMTIRVVCWTIALRRTMR
jgi:hypothetical protein